MAYDFGSDLIVGAMKAADPARLSQAQEALRSMTAARSATAMTPNENFSQNIKQLNARPAEPDATTETLKKFEAAILTTFVQSMMPKETESVYGEGLAGDMWKSQMAEKIADQLAQRGGVGIANRLLKDFHTVDDSTVPISGIRDATQAVEQSRAGDGASQFLQLNELQTLLRSEETSGKTTVIAPKPEENR